MEEKKLEAEFKNTKKQPIYTKKDNKQDISVASSRNQSLFDNQRDFNEIRRPLNRDESNESDDEPIYTSTTQRFPVPNQPPMLTTSAITTTSTRSNPRANSGQMKFSVV